MLDNDEECQKKNLHSRNFTLPPHNTTKMSVTNYVYIRKTVPHFKEWRTEHDAALEEREEAGLPELHMMNNTLFPNDVCVLLEPKNEKIAKSFIDSQEDINSGYEGDNDAAVDKHHHEEVSLMKKVKTDDDYGAKKGKSYCTRWFVIKLRVKDFDSWKEEYDHNAKTRLDGGLVESLMIQSDKDPNTIIIFFETLEGGFARTFSENRFLAKEKFVKKVKLGKSLMCKPEFSFFNKH